MAGDSLSLDPKETALIVVDMQNDFCHPQGFFARNSDRMMSIGLDPDLVSARIGSMKTLLEAARRAGLFIVHTQIIRDPDSFNKVELLHRIVPRTHRSYMDAPGDPPLVPDSWGADTHDELAPLPGEYVLVKRAYSSFYQTDLEMVLRRRGIRTVIVTGTVTYACVLHTAFDANVRDFRRNHGLRRRGVLGAGPPGTHPANCRPDSGGRCANVGTGGDAGRRRCTGCQ